VSEYEGAPYSLDLALVEANVALEIDGPTHFSRNSNGLLGHTVLKHRLLRAAGWTVIPIPFHEVLRSSCLLSLAIFLLYRHEIEVLSRL